MNILIPHTWLLEHLETECDPVTLQKCLSLCGPSVERIYEREGDSIYDIEVTTNRADAMSVRGIAREAAAILPQFNIDAELKPLSASEIPTPNSTLALPTINENDALNKRTICIVLSSINRAPTPEWMAQRLRALDIKIHDAAIDITNYITHELGHPCHAFDYDMLVAHGNTITITEAQPGESFTLLDGVKYTAVGGEVVFKDGTGEIIDLPSIKGTANSSINENTKRILLLAESIEAKKVRFASMTHAIRTTAAQLMEKNADPTLALDVIRLGIQQFQEICGAQVASELYDHFPAPNRHEPVTLSSTNLLRYLGVEIPLEKAKQMLERLECSVTLADDSLIVTPPSFRPDLTIPADIVEEVARMYGYHNLPSILMPTAIPTTPPANTNFQLEQHCKQFLAALGWQELYTYSMVSESIALQSGHSIENHLKLQNPLTDDRVYLRRSVLPSLNEIILQNSHLQSLSVFELAHVYHPQKNALPIQELELSFVSTQSYQKVKGVLEVLLRQSFITLVETPEQPVENTPFTQRAHLNIAVNGTKTESIGDIGVLQTGYVAATINFAILLKNAHSHPKYQPIPKTAPIIEDYTFTLPKTSNIGPIITDITAVNTLIHSVVLLDSYQANHTFRVTYWDYENSLTNERVEPLRKAVITTVETAHTGTLVGTLE